MGKTAFPQLPPAVCGKTALRGSFQKQEGVEPEKPAQVMSEAVVPRVICGLLRGSCELLLPELPGLCILTGAMGGSSSLWVGGALTWGAGGLGRNLNLYCCTHSTLTKHFACCTFKVK